MTNAVNLSPQAVAVGMGVLVVGFLLYKTAQAAPAAVAAAVDMGTGLVTGNNAITQNQTNADGEKTTAYEGAGILGTLGGAFNSASGGWFATTGEQIGGWIYDTTHTTPQDPKTGSW